MGLNLSYNYMEDIGNLRSSSQIDVSQNQGRGTIPQSMTHLTNSSILDLWQNSRSSVIPQGTANLQALTEYTIFNEHQKGLVQNNSGHLTSFHKNLSRE
ncbi:unnamed protein product [Sphagnum balticum]